LRLQGLLGHGHLSIDIHGRLASRPRGKTTMNRVIWGVGWLLGIAGWFAIVAWPARVGLLLCRRGETPGAAELVPLGVMLAMGIGLIVLGNRLRRRSATRAWTFPTETAPR
jgi:hypothetical protein